jgi:hypothetical protein
MELRSVTFANQPDKPSADVSESGMLPVPARCRKAQTANVKSVILLSSGAHSGVIKL